MIITRNWLNEFINIQDISTKKLCIALNSIGLEIDSTSKISIPNGVKTGLIVDCQKHPDATKLNICQVDLGLEQVQIVCGAKNVAKGQMVAVATVGTILDNDFTIKKAQLRGVDSHGMICGSSEINLLATNDGIMVLDNSIGELVLGKELNTYDLLNDEIIEIELTANRGDCLSVHGIARDLSAYFNLNIHSFDPNINYSNTTIGQIVNVSLVGDLTSNINISSADFTNFKLPVLFALRASFASFYKSNDILTALQYATHCFGVLYDATSHELDTDDYGLYKLEINKDPNGFESFYGKEKISIIGVDTNDIIIDKDTKHIDKIMLCSYYINPEFIAQKVFDTKIKTSDVYYRSSRGSETNIDMGTLHLNFVLSQCGAIIHKSSKQFKIQLNDINLTIPIKKINSIIGQDIPAQKIIQILESLKFKVKIAHDDILSLTIPTFRHDIKNVADISEEIIRMIGIDNIQAKPLQFTEINNKNNTSNLLVKQNKLRLKAISNGFYEAISYIFTSKQKLEMYNFSTVDNKLDITNPITKELNTFRTTLLVNLIDAISNNYKHGYNSVSLFEIGIILIKIEMNLNL
jgi:phenylalanyl-tRNA synthetase beta chain